MGIIETLLISLALSMDAFAVAITCGLSCKGKITPLKRILKVGLFFGFFQAIMPIIGYFAGSLIPFDITSFDHWIAFGLLAYIGIHMIKESFDHDSEVKKNCFKTSVLFISAVATSIDALAAGFSLSLLGGQIEVLTISAGLITLIVSMSGVRIGNKFGHIFEKRAEQVSGLVLILIGLKILIEHLFF